FPLCKTQGRTLLKWRRRRPGNLFVCAKTLLVEAMAPTGPGTKTFEIDQSFEPGRSEMFGTLSSVAEWQRRRNLWRKATNPARAAKRPTSVRVVFRYRRKEMTKAEQVVGMIFQVTMWAYIAAAAAYVVIG